MISHSILFLFKWSIYFQLYKCKCLWNSSMPLTFSRSVGVNSSRTQQRNIEKRIQKRKKPSRFHCGENKHSSLRRNNTNISGARVMEVMCTHAQLHLEYNWTDIYTAAWKCIWNDEPKRTEKLVFSAIAKACILYVPHWFVCNNKDGRCK